MVTTTQAVGETVVSGQVTVGATATQIAHARPGRRSILIVNEGTTAVRIGPPGVTTGNGVLLPGAVGASIRLEGGGAVYGIVASGSQAVSFIESI
jgi:hypothetical protein